MTDEVRLLNGDRLRGEIVKLEGSRLTLRMSHSGDVSIDRTQVESLTTNKPLKVQVDEMTEMPTLINLFLGHAEIAKPRVWERKGNGA